MKTTEGLLKDKIKVFLKDRGAYYHMPVPSGYGMQTLDFLGCYQGFFFAIETKAPGKVPTPRQWLCIEQIKKAGGFAGYWDNYETFARQWFEWIEAL